MRKVIMVDDFCAELTPGMTDAVMSIIASRQGLIDVCDICGRPVDNGDTVCRHCHKRQDSLRRQLRLVKERKRQGVHYGRV